MPVLRSIVRSAGQPSRDPEDFSVLIDDRAVGRIHHTTGGARGDGYAWFIYGSPRSGFATTRDQAATEWKAAFERWQGEKRDDH
jgi:hypothetical protein